MNVDVTNDTATRSEGVSSSVSDWEAAYARFETPEEERRKFIRRLQWLGAPGWPKDASIVEIFCGRGNGMHALSQLGFQRLEGVDLSPRLVGLYQGPARTYVADCRRLPFPDRSRDILIVQGGLHHLDVLPDDLEQVLSEVGRVLRPGGLFVAVEPWQTPFLGFVHLVSSMRPVRRLWNKMDAFARMTELELRTYEQWLSRPGEILASLDGHFTRARFRIGWGKLMYVGKAGEPRGA